MPGYKNSKTQSKNGGRRRKQTKRKLRRARKSRKVMRGGDDASLRNAIIQNDDAIGLLNTNGMNPTTVTKAQIETDSSLKLQLKLKGIDIAKH